MTRTLALFLAAAVLLLPALSQAGQPPAVGPVGVGPGPAVAPQAGLPVGVWRVEFANGVTECCVILKNGMASVAEPLRASGGKAAVQGASVVLAFDDDRVERWTAVGQRFIVEHWHPAAGFPAATPVRGIAERGQ